MKLHMLMRLILIVEGAESSSKVWDNGSYSYGSYQIKECVVEDVNRVYGTRFGIDDLYNDKKARAIGILYLMHWSETRRVSELESLARIWNGGPNGHKKESTIKYWEKIKRAGASN